MSGEHGHRAGARPGLVLPWVVVLMAGLWVLALCVLTLTGLSRRAVRLELHHLQAELALEAGMADACDLLRRLCDNDDYLVIAESQAHPRQPALLHGVQPELGPDGRPRFHYLPLHSRADPPPTSVSLRRPATGEATSRTAFRTHPWLDPVEVEWLPLKDEQGRMVARYAFWVEDLQALFDAGLSAHLEPHPGFALPGCRVPSLQALDPDPDRSGLQRLMAGRDQLRSPGSALAAAGLAAPLVRIAADLSPERSGQLADAWAAALERHATVGIQAYEEQPRVPFVHGISPSAMGRPRCNLNHMLRLPPVVAVDQMAEWIDAALPDFKHRAGGFPEDYLKTLAASALDYADLDCEPISQWGSYLGIDGQPFLSEIVLHIHFRRLQRVEDRWVLSWTLRLFAELWNPTSQPIREGEARLSYEVNLRPSAVGLGAGGRPFDDPLLLDDPRQTQHSLEQVDGVYLTAPVAIVLPVDGYRFHEFARVDYQIECEPQLDAQGFPLPEWFDLIEPLEESRGLTLHWNGRPVQRLHSILRDPHGLANFRTDRSRKTAKACIPALNYGLYGAMINNPGDVRMAHYLRALPLGENAYPENISPHRRNVRRRNIYDLDPSPAKRRHYGRVLPSQWGDGGHDSATGNFFTTSGDAALPTDADKWPLADVPTPQPFHAPQRIANAGCVTSVAEWGHVHDPVMWTPAYPDRIGHSGSGSEDTAVLTGRKSIWLRPSMPEGRNHWPPVSLASWPSAFHGGGHSLRIGRPEHPRFDRPGMRATDLLDLFHCGQPMAGSASRCEGPVERVEGRVNLNTAHPEVLQALVWGELRQDPALARLVSPAHELEHGLRPLSEPWVQSPGQLDQVAETVAAAIVRDRPFASLSQLARVRDADGAPLFGNPQLHAPGETLLWSDAAAEELFARVHDAGCLRSRNFRIWVIGQSLAATASAEGGETKSLKVLATSKRAYTVFADPGERSSSGELVAENLKLSIRHASEF